MPKSDIEIAREATIKPIGEIAEKLGIPQDALYQYGPSKAKISFDHIDSLSRKRNGKLILVTAITPTPAGEGKTTMTVGLGDGLNRIGKNAGICLREPSLGPCFGMKGGAAGGGYAQVVPMEDINLHFTGDMHAIGTAHNLLAAMVDNHIYWGAKSGLDLRRVTWRRVVDMNDRALRDVTAAKGGVANGFPRETGFDITVASEIMAIFCLATDLKDLNRRLTNIIVGLTRDRRPVTVKQIKAAGSMTALLRDALMPNLVQTLEHNPAFIHGGPFANIAHGCNSAIATKTMMKLVDYTVTEAGFGADLGAEKFFDIKCRKAGLKPNCVVLVATVRALKMHGGVARADLGRENVKAVKDGLANLERHVRNLKKFGVPVVVGINEFTTDTKREHTAIRNHCKRLKVDSFVCTHWADGGNGTKALAKRVAELADSKRAKFKPLYPDSMKLWDKIDIIAKSIYGATGAVAEKRVRDQIDQHQASGYGKFPVCMAKTQYSFTADPDVKGAPKGFEIPIRTVQLSAGAEFLVAVCGEIMTMPGLPSKPAAHSIHVNRKGQIEGLF